MAYGLKACSCHPLNEFKVYTLSILITRLYKKPLKSNLPYSILIYRSLVSNEISKIESGAFTGLVSLVWL